MRITRGTKIAAIAAAGVLALAACSESSDDGSGDSSVDAGSLQIDCVDGKLSAEGSSAQKNAMFQWIKLYQENCGDSTVNYNPTGSGAGIKQFIAGQVDFAGSDAYLNASKNEVADAEKRCDAPAWNLPMVAGPIGIPINIEGVDTLTLDGETIAKIFTGEIDQWDDEAIASQNDGVSLPSEQIAVFFRSDESGTQKSFTSYLNTVAPEVWTMEPDKAWPSGAAPQAEGREKSSGVLEAVLTTSNSIAFLDWSDILAAQLGTVAVDTGSGGVALSEEAASAAVAAGEVVGTGNNLRIDLDYATTEPGVYPIVQLTYEIVCSTGLDADKTDLLKSFLGFAASDDGQSVLPSLGFTPLPDDIKAKVQTAVTEIS